MRFLADENVSRLIVDALRAQGHDVFSAREEMAGAPDPEILSSSAQKSRLLITEDIEFSDRVVRHGTMIVGLILLELGRLSPAAQANRVAGAITASISRLEGSVTVIEPARVRVRPLPNRP